MVTVRVILFSVFITSLTFCSSRNINRNNIDDFVLKYNDVRFKDLKDITVAQRSKDINEIVYIVGRYTGNQPVYFVTYNTFNKEITSVNKSNLEKSKVKDYLTQSEIINAVEIVSNHGFYLLSVDSSENVFINPFHPNEPPFFLRLKILTGDSIIKMGYVYKLYIDNWYINNSKLID